MAYTFASGNYIELPSDSSMDSTKGAMSFWIKTTQTTSNVVPFSRCSASASVSGFTIILNNGGPTGFLTMGIKNSGGTYVIGAGGTKVVNDDKWHHAVFNWDRTSGGTHELYVDGVLDRTATSSGAWAFAGNVVRYGKCIDTFWGNYVGTIGEVAWYSDSLTSSECKALSLGISPFFLRPGNLVFYTPLWN